MEAVFTAAETWPHDGWLIPDLMQIQFPKYLLYRSFSLPTVRRGRLTFRVLKITSAFIRNLSLARMTKRAYKCTSRD
jgi:hypothetical protein